MLKRGAQTKYEAERRKVLLFLIFLTRMGYKMKRGDFVRDNRRKICAN
jgi:hypothetical protein